MWWRRVSAINSINATANQSWHLPIIISSNAPSWIGNELGVYHRGTDLPVKSLRLPQVEQELCCICILIMPEILNYYWFLTNRIYYTSITRNVIPLTMLNHKNDSMTYNKPFVSITI
jgi:hypothetical protein